MASQTTHTVPYRRKREGRTNYKKRLALLKSGKPRLVIRRTNKQLIAQIVQYNPDGDKVLFAANGLSLKKLGWKYSCKSIPAAYLLGLVLGAKAKSKVKEAILDLGLITPINGSRVYAVAKGVSEYMPVHTGEEVYPKKERLNGKHIADHFAKNKDKFTGYQKGKTDPGSIQAEVKSLKEKISK